MTAWWSAHTYLSMYACVFARVCVCLAFVYAYMRLNEYVYKLLMIIMITLSAAKTIYFEKSGDSILHASLVLWISVHLIQDNEQVQRSRTFCSVKFTIVCIGPRQDTSIRGTVT